MECYFYTTGRPALFQAELHYNKDKASGAPPLLIYPVSWSAITFMNLHISSYSLKHFFESRNCQFQFTDKTFYQNGRNGRSFVEKIWMAWYNILNMLRIAYVLFDTKPVMCLSVANIFRSIPEKIGVLPYNTLYFFLVFEIDLVPIFWSHQHCSKTKRWITQTRPMAFYHSRS